MSSQGIVEIHEARLRELPELVRLVRVKFLEHDGRYRSGGRLARVRRRAEVIVGAWGEMLSADVWTDLAHDAVVCETPRRRKPRFWAAVAVVALLFSPLVALPNGALVALVTLMAVLLPFLPGGIRDLRRARQHRSGAAVLTFLASRRPGAGRALLDARCEAADARRAWLCLDAPEALEEFYRGSGFERVGHADITPGRTIYMERAPRG
ncbi:MAG: hypothetical protein ACLGI2_14535 [Acidimicrobiia bacterium]